MTNNNIIAELEDNGEIELSVFDLEKFFNSNKDKFDSNSQYTFKSDIKDMKKWKHANDNNAVTVWKEMEEYVFEW